MRKQRSSRSAASDICQGCGGNHTAVPVEGFGEQEHDRDVEDHDHEACYDPQRCADQVCQGCGGSQKGYDRVQVNVGEFLHGRKLTQRAQRADKTKECYKYSGHCSGIKHAQSNGGKSCIQGGTNLLRERGYNEDRPMRKIQSLAVACFFSFATSALAASATA